MLTFLLFNLFNRGVLGTDCISQSDESDASLAELAATVLVEHTLLSVALLGERVLAYVGDNGSC
jgi:hypothetical protein